MWHMHVVSMQKWHPFGWVRVNFSWYPLDIVLSCTRFPSFTLPWCWLASCWSYVFLRMAMAVAADEAACLGEAIPRVDMKSVELQEYCSVGCCKLFVIYVSSYDMSSVSRVCTHLEYWERVPFWSVLARRCCHRSNEIYLTFMISFGVDFWPFLETNGKTTTYVKLYVLGLWGPFLRNLKKRHFPEIRENERNWETIVYRDNGQVKNELLVDLHFFRRFRELIFFNFSGNATFSSDGNQWKHDFQVFWHRILVENIVFFKCLKTRKRVLSISGFRWKLHFLVSLNLKKCIFLTLWTWTKRIFWSHWIEKNAFS